MKHAASFASLGVIAVITAFTLQESSRQPGKQINRGDKIVKDSTYNCKPSTADVVLITISH